MALHTLFRTAVAAGLLAAGFAAQAGTVTFDRTFLHGNGNVVNIKRSGSTSNPTAGAFRVSISGFSAFNQSFDAFCVELDEYISLGGSYENYELLSAANYFSDSDVTSNLTKLISYANNSDAIRNASDQSMQSSALQLAIWNLVYDTDSTLESGGAFTEVSTAGLRATPSSGSFIGSNALLMNALSPDSQWSSGYSLYVLSHKDQQDQLIWVKRNDIPEPASLALVALALGGAAFASRRRG